MSSASKSSDLRFAFGENWADFLVTVNKEKIENACKKLTELLGLENLSGKSFLDIGSGSGLSSLAAHYLGATVHSFDFDEVSVNCTEELRRQYGQKSRDWVVGRGDVLDEGFMRSLGEFDIVYSWGVLHHTGNMSLALKQSRERVRPGGLLFVAIYNDQGSASRRWRWIKRTYNRLPVALRFLVALPSAVWLWGPTVIRDASRGNPFASWMRSLCRCNVKDSCSATWSVEPPVTAVTSTFSRE
jgi:2-polyprenyl-3-methyl-5-hydroxy-6-metoxy-1,4-benzoquinol methylase